MAQTPAPKNRNEIMPVAVALSLLILAACVITLILSIAAKVAG